MKKNVVILKDCWKTFTVDQDKAISPQATLENFYARVQSLDLNILNEVRRVDNGRLGIPVYFSVCGSDAQQLTGTKKQMGKGASPTQAEASACMELAERFSFFSFKSNPQNFITGDYTTVKKMGYPVLNLNYLLESVHDSTTSAAFLEQLLANIPLQWTWGTNLTKNEQVLIPFSWFFAINEFNGPSAGNTYEEAALQGICEIVERHVCSIISNGRVVTRSIDTSSVTDPVARDLLERFKTNGIELYCNDFSLDTGICTVGALAVDRETFPEKSEIVFTAGTTPDPEKALIRAITEVAQLAGDFNTGSNYVASGLPKPLSMDDVGYVTDTGESVAIGDMYNISDENIFVEVKNCIDSLRKSGKDVLTIDVTHDQLRIPALYTIVPGAHFRERSNIRDVGLFSAKLLVELTRDPELVEQKLRQMGVLLPGAYFIEFYRGRNFLEAGDARKALVNFRNALHLQPEKEDIPYIYSYMGSCLKNLGRFTEALEVLNKGLAEDEERADIHNTMGVCYYKIDKFMDAIRHFHRAVELNPASGIDYANLGVNYAKTGNRDTAIEYLTVALTLDPELDFAQELMSNLLN
jgi:ribosomal protein S12 methylthiotransferase accessory factor